MITLGHTSKFLYASRFTVLAVVPVWEITCTGFGADGSDGGAETF